jgi:hypothetical protein
MFSSIKYSVFKEGMAIKISIKAGKEVQNSSISCDSKKNRLMFLLKIEEVRINRVLVVTKNKIIIVWS